MKKSTCMCKVCKKELADGGGTSNLQKNLKKRNALTEVKVVERSRQYYSCFQKQRNVLPLVQLKSLS